MAAPADHGKFKLVIKKIMLHIPVGVMNLEIYRSITDKLARSNAVLQFRRIDITTKMIPFATENFETDLFSPRSNPSRVYIMFLKNACISGAVGQNPFQFRCFWVTPGAGLLGVDEFFCVTEVRQ